jgi:hypothetical protein
LPLSAGNLSKTPSPNEIVVEKPGQNRSGKKRQKAAMNLPQFAAMTRRVLPQFASVINTHTAEPEETCQFSGRIEGAVLLPPPLEPGARVSFHPATKPRHCQSRQSVAASGHIRSFLTILRSFFKLHRMTSREQSSRRRSACARIKTRKGQLLAELLD